MLKKRIIACLDIKDGRTVKGTNFKNLRDAGDAVELASIYAQEGIDELVFLDISASLEKRSTLRELSARVAEVLDIPFTVGGGISEVTHAAKLLEAGADKISLNSAALAKPDLIDELAAEFGRQFVTVAIDAKWDNGNYSVYSHGGSLKTNRKLQEWVAELEERGAGEILLTSMAGDGTKEGFDLPMYRTLSEIKLPLIASGGAGKPEHFAEVLDLPQVDAALAASLFHFKELKIKDLKDYLSRKDIAIRND